MKSDMQNIDYHLQQSIHTSPQSSSFNSGINKTDNADFAQESEYKTAGSYESDLGDAKANAYIDKIEYDSINIDLMQPLTAPETLILPEPPTPSNVHISDDSVSNEDDNTIPKPVILASEDIDSPRNTSLSTPSSLPPPLGTKINHTSSGINNSDNCKGSMKRFLWAKVNGDANRDNIINPRDISDNYVSGTADFSELPDLKHNDDMNNNLKRDEQSESKWKKSTTLNSQECSKNDEYNCSDVKHGAIWPSARHGHRMVSLAGRFCVMYGGAVEGGKIDDSLFVFDAWKNRWFLPRIKGATKPPGLASFGIASDGQRFVYICGGIRPNLTINTSLFILDCQQWTWRAIQENSSATGSPDLSAVFGCSLNYYNGSVIRYGGIGISESYPQRKLMLYSNRFCVLKCRELHALAKEGGKYNWSLVDTSSFDLKPRESHTALVFGNSLYIFGGTNIDRLACSWKIDLEKWTCQYIGNFTSDGSGRAMHSSCIIDNQVYHFGGLEQPTVKGNSNAATSYLLDPKSNNTDENDDLNITSKRSPSSETAVETDTKRTKNKSENATSFDKNSDFRPAGQRSKLEYYALDDAQNKVCVAAEYPNKIKSRANHACCTLNSRIYILGGRCNVSTDPNATAKLKLLRDMHYLDVAPPKPDFRAITCELVENSETEGSGCVIYLLLDSCAVDCHYCMVVAYRKLPDKPVQPELISCSQRHDFRIVDRENFGNNSLHINAGERNNGRAAMKRDPIEIKNYYDLDSNSSRPLEANSDYYLAIYPYNNFGMGECTIVKSRITQAHDYIDPRHIKISMDRDNLNLSWTSSPVLIHTIYGYNMKNDQILIDETRKSQIEYKISELLKFCSKTNIGYVLALGIASSCFPPKQQINLNDPNVDDKNKISKLSEQKFLPKRILRINIHIF
ncbi:MAG: Host cell factor 2 [Marteilia pararefringens]